MKIIFTNKLNKKTVKKDLTDISKIILNNPELKSYLKGLKHDKELMQIYDHLEKGIKIEGLSLDELIQLVQKYSDALIVQKKIDSRISFLDAFKKDSQILICNLIDNTDEILQEIYEFIEFPSIKSKYEVFLINSSKKNSEIMLKKEGITWEIISPKSRFSSNWKDGIKFLIKKGFTINFICFKDCVKKNTSSIESVYSIKQMILEKKKNIQNLETSSKFQITAIKGETIVSREKFWLCNTCSLPNHSNNFCDLCGSPNS